MSISPITYSSVGHPKRAGSLALRRARWHGSSPKRRAFDAVPRHQIPLLVHRSSQPGTQPERTDLYPPQPWPYDTPLLVGLSKLEPSRRISQMLGASSGAVAYKRQLACGIDWVAEHWVHHQASPVGRHLDMFA